jgi:hypothetical protein
MEARAVRLSRELENHVDIIALLLFKSLVIQFTHQPVVLILNQHVKIVDWVFVHSSECTS